MLARYVHPPLTLFLSPLVLLTATLKGEGKLYENQVVVNSQNVL